MSKAAGATGTFVLSPVVTGTHDLLVTATRRLDAVMTGTPAAIRPVGSSAAHQRAAVEITLSAIVTTNFAF